MNNKKIIKLVLIVVAIILVAVISFLIFTILKSNSSIAIVESNEGIKEKSYATEYKNFKIQEESNQTQVYFNGVYQLSMFGGAIPAAGYSDFLLVFQDGKLVSAQSIFNYNHFILEGNAELIDSRIKNIHLRSTNEGVTHKSVEYIIKDIKIEDPEHADVEEEFNSTLPLLDDLRNSPRL